MYSGIHSKLRQKQYKEADKEFKEAESILCRKTYQDMKSYYLKNELKELFDKDLPIEAKNLFGDIQTQEFPIEECIYKQLKKEFFTKKQQLIEQQIQGLLDDYQFEDAKKLYFKNKEYILENKFTKKYERCLQNQQNDIHKQINDLLDQNNLDDALICLNKNEKYLTEKTSTYLKRKINILKKIKKLFQQKKFDKANLFFLNQKIVSDDIFKSLKKEYKDKLECLSYKKEEIKKANKRLGKVEPQL